MVPSRVHAGMPAWPETLTFIRAHQLPDGGWGAPRVYNAHERTISTLACLLALRQWPAADDAPRIERGVSALYRYARDLPAEIHEPVGFELLLPRLVDELRHHGLALDPPEWQAILRIAEQKRRLIGEFKINYEKPRSWWFNLEMLPDDALARIDPRLLNRFGSVETSIAATAAYLRALRQHGKDNARADAFLHHVVHFGGGGVGFCWPIEVFELTWTLDSFWRAGIDPNTPFVATLLRQLSRYWSARPAGLSSSGSFMVSDGDDTSMGYAVLRWGGLYPSPEPLFSFWRTDHFRTYHDERTPSVTVNLHALAALRQDLDRRDHKQLALVVTEWLRRELRRNNGYTDKWHFSPVYVAAHAVSTLAGWDDEMAREALDFLLAAQQFDGGWGEVCGSTLEETAHAVLGLAVARRMGLLRDAHPLVAAHRFFRRHEGEQPTERLWIGKTLFHPPGLVRMLLYAARTALAQQTDEIQRRYWQSKDWLPLRTRGR